MKRPLTIVLGLALLLSLAMPQAQAAKPDHDRYRSRVVNAFWHSRRHVDRHTYLRITWYAGVYETQDHFFSDLYRSVEKCRRNDGGGSRCRYQQRHSWYGSIRKIGTGSFSLDRRLTSSHVDATYRLFRTVGHDRKLVGHAHIVFDVTGSGDLTRSRDSYWSKSGCTLFRYGSRYVYRQSVATGTLSMDGADAWSLGSTKDANMNAGTSLYLQHEC